MDAREQVLDALAKPSDKQANDDAFKESVVEWLAARGGVVETDGSDPVRAQNCR